MRQGGTAEDLDVVRGPNPVATRRVIVRSRLYDGTEASTRPQRPATQGVSGAALQIRCREVDDADIDDIIDLLTTGFRVRRREFWAVGLRRLAEHPTPPGFPKYGYLLECNGALVGVILLVFASVIDGDEPKTRCSVSSWYTDPAFRSYASMLTSHALRFKKSTYYNITPDPRTYPILEAQGYRRYCDGCFVAVPALSSGSDKTDIRHITAGTVAVEGLPSWEIELLRQHANYGCISIVCHTADRVCPFVFLTYRRFRVVPWAYLAYCRHVDDFIRLARPLGKFLARRGITLVELDSNGPAEGLVGRYFNGAPKYFKGPDRPRLGDIAYSERAMFGF
jgi:hypothetical protein